jgi:hypothetical protein
MKLIELKSVGSLLHPKKGMIYPQNADGSRDPGAGVYLDDASDEWFDSLSMEDYNLLIRASRAELLRSENRIADPRLTFGQFLLIAEALRSYIDLGLFHEDYDKADKARDILRTLEGKQKEVVK